MEEMDTHKAEKVSSFKEKSALLLRSLKSERKYSRKHEVWEER